MKIVQIQKEKHTDWKYLTKKQPLQNPLVFVFGDRYLLEDESIYEDVKKLFTGGHFVFGSTSANIVGESVEEQAITITAIEFEKTQFIVKSTNIFDSLGKDCFENGNNLIKQFSTEGLKFIFVVSEGSFVNGSELTKGMSAATQNKILITGGLCGDDDRFEKTIASYNEKPKPGEVIAIGFYGDTLEATFSIRGGWIPFGPERVVTKSKANVLYELDGKPALDLYKKYLGEKSNQLPAAALLYPLNVKVEGQKESVVRTILNINEQDNTMILAGDIPKNATVQLMMSNVDKIASASGLAAKQALESRKNNPQLAILVSCIGRKLLLDQRVEEELEEVAEMVGDSTTLCGFYSYGEIGPFDGEKACQLHNQTMTITLISE
ncbi:FIST signal transduction protein [Tenacibaculum sp. UWU-22]|uniref:FIST signal transduction protein n=1 Tax=Tenacibaculum sp. UWU-22 TaxID=3234187 RepID=UPI0034DAE6B8